MRALERVIGALAACMTVLFALVALGIWIGTLIVRRMWNDHGPLIAAACAMAILALNFVFLASHSRAFGVRQDGCSVLPIQCVEPRRAA